MQIKKKAITGGGYGLFSCVGGGIQIEQLLSSWLLPKRWFSLETVSK
jgi:hypothetical protein